MSANRTSWGISLVLAGAGVGLGLMLGSAVRQPTAAQEAKDKPPAATGKTDHDHLMADTQAAYAPDWDKPYPQYQPVGKALKPYPRLKPGEPPPQDLYR